MVHVHVHVLCPCHEIHMKPCSRFPNFVGIGLEASVLIREALFQWLKCAQTQYLGREYVFCLEVALILGHPFREVPL